jgi:hypothetical protein
MKILFIALALSLCTLVGRAQDSVADTRFNPDRGLFSGPLTVTLSSATPGAWIRHTTDGSVPPASGGAPSPVTVNLTRSTVLRAIAYLPSGAALPTNIDTHTYLIASSPLRWSGTTLAPTTAYPSNVWTSLQALPVLSIAMPASDFATVRDSGSGGIGSSGGNEQYERACSAEWIVPPHPRYAGMPEWQAEAGLRPHSWVTTKRAFRLYFKRIYGQGSLDEAVFDSAPLRARGAAKSFEKIVLRSHSNDGWESNWGGDDDALYLRDQFASATFADMGRLAPRATWAHLFVNGGYYGLYSPTERPDHDFQATYEGGAGDDYLGFNHGGVINEGASTALRDQAWNPADLSVPANYASFQSVLDVPQFTDFLLAAFYCNTHPWDWPVNGGAPQNFYGGNRNNPGHPVKHFIWDFEAALVWPAGVHPYFQNSSSNKTSVFLRTWFALRNNADFRMQFADRAHRLLLGGGALDAARTTRRIDALARHVQPALAAEQWQWGDPFGTWNARLASARAQIAANTASMIASMRSEGVYPANDPPTVALAGQPVTGDRLRVSGPVTLALANPNAAGAGSIRYTLTGMDPRASGGAVAAGALDAGHAANVPVTAPAILRARVLDGSAWSALREIVISPAQDFSGLRISEIHYHPSNAPVAGSTPVLDITGDIGGDQFGRARIRLEAAPPATLSRGDHVRITGASADANNGLFTIVAREADGVVLDQPLTNEGASPAAAEFLLDGDRYEFVELHNGGSTELDLTGVRFVDGIDFTFPAGTRLAAGARAVLSPAPWDFAARYGGTAQVFRCAGALDNAGETLLLVHDAGHDLEVSALSTLAGGQGRITLPVAPPAGFASNDWVEVSLASNVVNNGLARLDAVGALHLDVADALPAEAAGARVALYKTITRVSYNDRAPWPVSADGLGFSIVPSGQGSGPADPAWWRASAQVHGSPRAEDPSPAPRPALLVSEVLAHTDWPQTDTFEIHNPTAAPVDLAGWWITDDRLTPRKYALPSVIVPPGGYAAFLEDNDANPANNASLPAGFFGGTFSLGSDGDEAWLYSPDTGYGHGFSFGASANGESFGRLVTSDARERFVAQSAHTPGAANAGPRVGPVVITEIHYNPAAAGQEFVELQNISAAPVPLFSSTNRWELAGVSFTFPANVTLAAGEVVLVIHESASPTAFAAANSVPAGVRIWTCPGRLDNAGERISLRRPDTPNGALVPMIVMDELTYDDTAPWPSTPDGGGPSLERIQPGAFADDPANWRASASAGGTPGVVLPPNTPLIALSPAGFLLAAPAGSPVPNQTFQAWNAGTSTLNYTLSTNRAWLGVSPAGGTSTGPAQKTTHTVTVTTAGLEPGIHLGQITVSAPGAANHPAVIPVQIEVAAPDTVAPSILQARALDGTRVELVFSEPMNPGVTASGAARPGAYVLSPGGTATGAVLGSDGRTLTLTFASVSGGTSTLTVNGPADLAGNPVAPGTQVFIAYAADPVGGGLVARWPLDDGSGTTAADASGNNRAATLVNGPAWSSGGRQGGAVEFDGVNDRLDAGTWSVSGSALTIALWLRADDFDISDCRMVSKANGTAEADHWWMLGTVESGGIKLRARLKTGGTTTTLIASSGDVQPGVWIHAALVYDGATLKLFQDGVEVGSVAKTGALSVDDTVPVWVGDNFPSASRPFDGLLDDVRVYNRALNPTELAALVSGAAVDSDGDTDGLSDSWEITHFGSTSHPDGDPGDDADLDGMSNLEEWTAGTHPRLGASRLHIQSLFEGASASRILHWSSAYGRVYDIQVSTNLATGVWTPVDSGIPAGPPLNRWTNAPPADAEFQAYRVRARRP